MPSKEADNGDTQSQSLECHRNPVYREQNHAMQKRQDGLDSGREDDWNKNYPKLVWEPSWNDDRDSDTLVLRVELTCIVLAEEHNFPVGRKHFSGAHEDESMETDANDCDSISFCNSLLVIVARR